MTTRLGISVLTLIAEHEQNGLPQVELTARLARSKQQISALLAKLERDGLVRREQDEIDYRTWRVFLTDDGRRVVEREYA